MKTNECLGKPESILFTIIPRNWRWLNKLVANYFGYFWLPCPICGENFAGFEWLRGNIIWEKKGKYGEGVCYKVECKNKAHEMSLKNIFLDEFLKI